MKPPSLAESTVLLLLCSASGSCAGDELSQGPVRGYRPVTRVLHRYAAHQVERSGIPAYAIALVDERGIVWASALGDGAGSLNDRYRSRAARAVLLPLLETEDGTGIPDGEAVPGTGDDRIASGRAVEGHRWGYDRGPQPCCAGGQDDSTGHWISITSLARATAGATLGEGAVLSTAEFVEDSVHGHRRAVIATSADGFSSRIEILPEDGVAVVQLAAMQHVEGTLRRVGETALRMLLEHRIGRQPTLPALVQPWTAAERRLVGRWAGTRDTLDIIPTRHGPAVWVGPRFIRLGRSGESIVASGPLGEGPRFRIADSVITLAGDTLRALPRQRPPAPRPEIRNLVGEYGESERPAYVLERYGQPALLIDGFDLYTLVPAGARSYRLTGRGPRSGAAVAVEPAVGRTAAIRVDGERFTRREIDRGSGEVFRIEPIADVDSLRARALSIIPPFERAEHAADLVEVTELDSTIRKDIRYATARNFIGEPFYPLARAYLQRSVAGALQRVQERLAADGLGVKVFDAYRPWYVTRMFWDATPDSLKVFVANPARGSRHNRGAAVDLTLVELDTGEELDMGSGYDEFTERAYAYYPGGTSRNRWARDRLREAMEEEGFSVYWAEWWHFDHRGWDRYPIMNFTFEELEGVDR